MKDKKLEEQFNEYFDGVKVPENITEDAKKYVNKPARLPKFVKTASIAASFLLCTVAAIALILRAPSAAAPETPAVSYYKESEVSYSAENAYAASELKPELKFVERLAFSNNADVKLKRADFENGETAFALAEVIYVDGVRDDTEIYVEYTSGVFSPLKDYSDGEEFYYGGMSYRLTQEFDESGEPVSKVYAQKNGIKYYLSVTSSNTQSYQKYLKFIFG